MAHHPSYHSTPTEPCRLCISLVGPTLHELHCQIQQAASVCDIIEIRLDKLQFNQITDLLPLTESLTIPIIWTLRKKTQGGGFLKSEEARCLLFKELMAFKPDFVDLEADTPIQFMNELRALSPATQWILSWHDQDSTPKDLNPIFDQMTSIPADYYKMATQAKTMNDAMRMIRLSKRAQDKNIPFCGLCMGELGHCTRILAPVIGHPWTYASLKQGLESAEGQIPFQNLIQTYRFREITPNTAIYGLIGHPIDKSVSHLTHNAVFKELGIDAVYVKFDVSEDQLTEFMEEAADLEISGLSVTMPLKELVGSWTLKKTGLQVYNTLVFKQGGIEGFNTDGIGALKTLGSLDLKGKKMVVVGAGGVACAIAQEACRKGADVTLCNRTIARAKEMALRLNCAWGDLNDLNHLVKEGYDILVQATSVGMTPLENQMPIDADAIFPGSHVLEVIANPSETPLVREARRRNCKVYLGSDLFVHQAVQQFVCWFGPKIDPIEIEQIIRKHLPQQPHYIKLPPSKSHSIRAILLGAMAQGESTVTSLLDSPDISCAIDAARLLGAEVVGDHDLMTIRGVNGTPRNSTEIIDAGNSGQVLRFAAAFASLGEGTTVVTGDESIRSNRPIQPLIAGLKGLSAWSAAKGENGYAPIVVKGPLKPGKTSLDGTDSQPVSALIMAAAFLEGTTEITVINAGEKPWLALTLSWMDRLGVDYSHHHYENFIIKGKKSRPGFDYKVPGDFSSAAFPIVAALLTDSYVVIENADMEDVQGDKALIPLLQRMGANIVVDSEKQRLHIKGNGVLIGCVIDVNPIIDSVPILAVLGCMALGETRLVNGSIARAKECDRLKCITLELKKMGADIEETEEGLIIRQSRLKGAYVQSHNDHRIALSLMVASLVAEGITEIEGIECIKKSYPTFTNELKHFGGQIYASS